jgi:hypothetical protein
MKDNYESKGITIIQDGEPMTEEEEKVYKCSDCDLWVTSTESCCEEEEEEEEISEGCKWTDEKTKVDDDRGVECWLCEDCNAWQDWGLDCYNIKKEEEERDKCGYTGGMIEDFDGCGDLIDPQDTSMLGNTSYCIKCYEKHETTYYDKNPIEE